jgi:hypothetical protein
MVTTMLKSHLRPELSFIYVERRRMRQICDEDQQIMWVLQNPKSHINKNTS